MNYYQNKKGLDISWFCRWDQKEIKIEKTKKKWKGAKKRRGEERAKRYWRREENLNIAGK